VLSVEEYFVFVGFSSAVDDVILGDRVASVVECLVEEVNNLVLLDN
jgi:hypothetical protein